MHPYFLSILLFLSTLATGCVSNTPISPPITEGKFLVGAFNLHTFGPARIEKPEAMKSLVSISQRYDLLVLQEITDATESAPAELLAQINEATDIQYELLLSDRVGRTNRKEQYGFLYRPDRVNILDLYNYDDYEDGFAYDPAVAYIDIAGLTFSIITLHANPNAVIHELNRTIPVYEDILLRTGDADALIIGDLNADCSFLVDRDKPYVTLRNDSRFLWLIHDEVDTTVRNSTDCAYDRIIVTDPLFESISDGSVGVFNFPSYLRLSEEEALEVSDHLPVELELTVPSGTY